MTDITFEYEIDHPVLSNIKTNTRDNDISINLGKLDGETIRLDLDIWIHSSTHYNNDTINETIRLIGKDTYLKLIIDYITLLRSSLILKGK